MSIHIGAEADQIAPTILLPGDPLRARFIAETMLEKVMCFNEVRGMLGFTGYHGDRRVSVMGTGMGMPSLSIYVNELVRDYGVRTLIRVGTCGAMQPDLKIGEIILAMTASSDSNINRLRFTGMDFAPSASFRLLLKAYETAAQLGLDVQVGGVFSGDSFYTEDKDWWKVWAKYGLLACEMETAALYTLAASFQVEALSILTVSDSLVSGEASSAEQREKEFPLMARLALEAAL